MKKIVLLCFYLCALNNIHAQPDQENKLISTCAFKDLSANFDFTVTINWAENDFDMPFAGSIQVEIVGKNSRSEVQIVMIQSEFMAVIFDSFSCANKRSFYTGINADEEIIDNNWGNFIVRDFNFDNREDFAVKVADNNVGSLYAYYVQHDGGFRRADYLSDQVGLMIDSFDVNTLQAYRSAPAGCCKMIHYTYQYIRANQDWALIKTEEEDLTQE